MRHQLRGRKFNRSSSHRKALFKNLSIAVIEHEFIKTTLPKAKDLRRVLEPLITMAKTDSVANRRLASARLGNEGAVKKLFEVLGPRYQQRQGGYLRLLKCGFRAGDRAPMCFVELLDREGSAAEAAVDTEAAPGGETAKKEAASKPKKSSKKADGSKSEAAKGEEKPKAKARKPKAPSKKEE